MGNLPVNKLYFVKFFEALCREQLFEAKALDFGCGRGDIVQHSRKLGYQFFGLESYYAGVGKQQHDAKDTLFNKHYIRLYNGGERFPFDDSYFDFIYSNQVVEHIEFLEIVLQELYRILKPGGLMVHCFPTREIVIEPHSGALFLHRLKDSRLKYVLLKCCNALGILSACPQNMTFEDWSHEKIEFIENQCHYRSTQTIQRVFGNYFEINRADKEKLIYHLTEKSSNLLRLMCFAVFLTPNHIIRMIEQRRGSITLICKKGL